MNSSQRFQVQQHNGDQSDLVWMHRALELAELAAREGEVPIGAVLVADGVEVGSGYNQPICRHDPTAHAEITAIRSACRHLENYRVQPDTTLYVTLVPCLMCLGAVFHARVGRVVIAAGDSRFAPPLNELLAHFEGQTAWPSCRFETDCLAEQSKALLLDFFESRRQTREASLILLANLSDLPNMGKTALRQLQALGFQTGRDLLEPSIEVNIERIEQCIQTLGRLEHEQEIAMLTSLCDYLRGNPVRSWKDYLPNGEGRAH